MSAEHPAAVASAPVGEGVVRGERAAALVNNVRSLHARLSSALAAALMIALGVAALAWYYAHAFTRPAQVRERAQAAGASRAQGEMALPALGPIAGPALPAPAALERAASVELPPPALLSEAPAVVAPAPAAGVETRSPQQLRLERRLSGGVFVRDSHGESSPAAPGAAASPASAAAAGTVGGATLATLLAPTLTAAVQAQRSPELRFLLPKGAFLDCTLETAIDSTLPGMTTCVTAADTFGADGSVVLLERGTKLVGETRGEVQQGQARLFVLWTQARTPAGVVVPLDSPGTDALGRAGLTGEVQRHFWERFGAAMLISLFNGAVQAGVQAAGHGDATVIYPPAGSQEVLTEVLKETLRIAPTISVRNGERIQVLVARDIDFRAVYELTLAARR